MGRDATHWLVFGPRSAVGVCRLRRPQSKLNLSMTRCIGIGAIVGVAISYFVFTVVGFTIFLTMCCKRIRERQGLLERQGGGSPSGMGYGGKWIDYCCISMLVGIVGAIALGFALGMAC